MPEEKKFTGCSCIEKGKKYSFQAKIGLLHGHTEKRSKKIFFSILYQSFEQNSCQNSPRLKQSTLLPSNYIFLQQKLFRMVLKIINHMIIGKKRFKANKTLSHKNLFSKMFAEGIGMKISLRHCSNLRDFLTFNSTLNATVLKESTFLQKKIRNFFDCLNLKLNGQCRFPLSD